MPRTKPLPAPDRAAPARPGLGSAPGAPPTPFSRRWPPWSPAYACRWPGTCPWPRLEAGTGRTSAWRSKPGCVPVRTRCCSWAIRGRPHPLLAAEELEKELAWCRRNPWGAGAKALLGQDPRHLLPLAADLARERLDGVYGRHGFESVGLAEPLETRRGPVRRLRPRSLPLSRAAAPRAGRAVPRLGAGRGRWNPADRPAGGLGRPGRGGGRRPAAAVPAAGAPIVRRKACPHPCLLLFCGLWKPASSLNS